MRPLACAQVLALAYRSGEAWNESGFASEAFDTKLAEAMRTADVEKRKVIMKDVEQLLQDSGVIIQPYWMKLYCHKRSGGEEPLRPPDLRDGFQRGLARRLTRSGYRTTWPAMPAAITTAQGGILAVTSATKAADAIRKPGSDRDPLGPRQVVERRGEQADDGRVDARKSPPRGRRSSQFVPERSAPSTRSAPGRKMATTRSRLRRPVRWRHLYRSRDRRRR